MITLGFYAPFVPEAGGKGTWRLDDLLESGDGRSAGRNFPGSPQRRRPWFPPLRSGEVVRGR
ncbi:hypothetical protein GCM10010282_68670 [Streptomyces roseolus]|nr:hypothetical protein GCM10010282_68670 [Streptomyces roseolus]